MQTILMIEDQADIQLTVRSLLGPRARVLVAPTAEAALQSGAREAIDLILLDVSLPDGDGFQLFHRLKALPGLRTVPVIFLTGKAEVSDRVAGFSLGADDYVVKPFEPLEFRARLEAKLAAIFNRKHESDLIRAGRLELDRTRLRALIQDESGQSRDIGLTPHEFKLLAHFVTHEGQVFGRDQLMTVIWGSEVHVLERTIDRHVSSLRKKVGARVGRLESIHGQGYRFVLGGETAAAA